MCTLAIISMLFPVMFWWTIKSQMYAKDHGKVKYECYWPVIKADPWNFSLHTVAAIFTIIGVIFGFWRSLDDLVDNINGN